MKWARSALALQDASFAVLARMRRVDGLLLFLVSFRLLANYVGGALWTSTSHCRPLGAIQTLKVAHRCSG